MVAETAVGLRLGDAFITPMVTEGADEQAEGVGRPASAAETLRLTRWWVVALLLAWYPVRDIPLSVAVPVIAVVAVAAAGLVVALRRCPPQHTAGKVVAYLCAMVANQGADIFYGVAALMPGSAIELVTPSPWVIAYVVARALLALWTFQIVRSWLGRDLREPLQQNKTRRSQLVSRIAAAGAALVVIYVANVIYANLADLLRTPEFAIPPAPGGTSGFLILAISLGLAGVVEEPVFIGIAALLWPRNQRNAFLAAAIVSTLARSTIHVYYAVGAGSATATAVLLVILWCALWSGFNLYVVYRTGRLWPVMLAHGLQNMATIAAPTFVMTNAPAASLVMFGILACYLVIVAGSVVYIVMRIRAVRA